MVPREPSLAHLPEAPLVHLARPGPDGGPPSNWRSRFGGSAWTSEPRTGQYYYHAFLESQPDLNWHNPALREAVADALRFWLRRGVDGFRLGASTVLGEDKLLRDDPPKEDADEHTPPPATPSSAACPVTD